MSEIPMYELTSPPRKGMVRHSARKASGADGEKDVRGK